MRYRETDRFVICFSTGCKAWTTKKKKRNKKEKKTNNINMSAYGNCSAQPSRDLLVNSLAICAKGGLALAKTAIPFAPSIDFQLTKNQSFVVNGNMIQLAIEGVVTGDIQNVEIYLGAIPAAYGPLTSFVAPKCVPSGLVSPPEFILVTEVEPDGKIHTCTSGAPFPPGSYDISVNSFYMI